MLSHRRVLHSEHLSMGAGGSLHRSHRCPSFRTSRRPLGGTMQALVAPVTKAIFVALFLFAILLILCVILWYICWDLDNDSI